ncbi:Uncharacterized protein FWK35_00025253 [Aphis craccivora]|uniref:Uncharacterized protein n=1 Tax=Aphis craccivora TaxID=307492 RepID=A0A6G0VYJ9_APHCR|nr:Uncharacterized protein FWK35_00025253 [Aphis craccivora]
MRNSKRVGYHRHDDLTIKRVGCRYTQCGRQTPQNAASERYDASSSTAWKRQPTCGTACGGERPGTLGGRGGGKPPRELWHPRCSLGDFVETTVARKRVRVRTPLLLYTYRFVRNPRCTSPTRT